MADYRRALEKIIESHKRVDIPNPQFPNFSWKINSFDSPFPVSKWTADREPISWMNLPSGYVKIAIENGHL